MCWGPEVLGACKAAGSPDLLACGAADGAVVACATSRTALAAGCGSGACSGAMDCSACSQWSSALLCPACGKIGMHCCALQVVEKAAAGDVAVAEELTSTFSTDGHPLMPGDVMEGLRAASMEKGALPPHDGQKEGGPKE